MQRFSPSDFSFTPLLSMVPGVLLLGTFSMDGAVSGTEVFLSALVIVSGGVWAGLKSSRALPETVGRTEVETTVDTALASAILDALPDPVLLLDNRRQVIAANRAADDLLGDGVHGRDVCLTLRHPDAQQAVKGALDGRPVRSDTEIVFDSLIRRVYQLQVMAVPKSASVSVRAVVALHEVTALKHVEDMRADFVANVSHELRSPLSSLTGFIETLQTTAKDDAPAQARFLTIMDGEACRMTRLIDDLLSLSRIEVNEHIRPTGRVRINDILKAVVQSVDKRATQKGMRLEMHGPQNSAEVAGDADELRQVMQNLIDNAVTYGAANSAVIITTRTLGYYAETGTPGVEISVQNFGEGIAEEHVPRLTERFYRVDKGRSRAMGGTGLGLAIVKHIVNHHRGRLIVTSTVGQGSTFSVRLPAADKNNDLKTVG